MASPLKPVKVIGSFFKTKIGLLVLGFILTTFCGTIINGFYADSTWKRDKRFELLQGELKDHRDLLSDLSKMVGNRTFRLQRVVWVTDSDASPAPETWQMTDEGKARLNTRWNEYYECVADWNVNYRNYAIKLRIFAGDDIADRFFVGEPNGTRKSKSGTLCWYFEQCHEKVSELKKAALTSRIDRKNHDVVQREVDELYTKVDDFMTQLYRTLGEKEHSEDPFEPVSSAH
jgi:hypothetical protein